jgi:hypothetical protein
LIAPLKVVAPLVAVVFRLPDTVTGPVTATERPVRVALVARMLASRKFDLSATAVSVEPLSASAPAH